MLAHGVPPLFHRVPASGGACLPKHDHQRRARQMHSRVAPWEPSHHYSQLPPTMLSIFDAVETMGGPKQRPYPPIPVRVQITTTPHADPDPMNWTGISDAVS